MNARLAALLLLCGSALLGGCENRAVAAAQQESALGRQARAAYSDPAEFARVSAGLYAGRRAAAGGKPLDMAPMLAAMAAAAAAAWGVEPFDAAARAVPPIPVEVAAPQAAFADALEAARHGRAPNASDHAETIAASDVAATLPARFGPEVTLLVQRMVAGYAARAEGRATQTAPAGLAAEIIREGRAAAAVGPDSVREGRGGPTAQTLRELEQSSGGAYWARNGLAAMQAADAQRLIAWNRSAAGRAYNDALLARWAAANDAASIDMLTRFFSAQVPTANASR